MNMYLHRCCSHWCNWPRIRLSALECWNMWWFLLRYSHCKIVSCFWSEDCLFPSRCATLLRCGKIHRCCRGLTRGGWGTVRWSSLLAASIRWWFHGNCNRIHILAKRWCWLSQSTILREPSYLKYNTLHCITINQKWNDWNLSKSKF